MLNYASCKTNKCTAHSSLPAGHPFMNSYLHVSWKYNVIKSHQFALPTILTLMASIRTQSCTHTQHYGYAQVWYATAAKDARLEVTGRQDVLGQGHKRRNRTSCLRVTEDTAQKRQANVKHRRQSAPPTQTESSAITWAWNILASHNE